MKRVTQSKRIDNLIIRQLTDEQSGLGFDQLIKKIWSYQNRYRAEYPANLSRKTLAQHLKKLVEDNIVNKQKSTSPKRKVYALDGRGAQFTKILVNIAMLKNTLDFYDSQPFFGFFQQKEGAPPKAIALKQISDAMRVIMNQIDSYLEKCEV